MYCLTEAHPAREVNRYLPQFRVAVVLVKAGETEERAWRRHVREHPQDRTAEVRIFHIDTSDSP
jgi:hypothetical protein|uniref:Uncharacterized protein n=1 Tax=Desulfobacca acetoxidans TaxID=60893 RepID=A0A7C3SHX1_9BACT